MENEELIRQNMEVKREALTEKLETLEDKLIGSVRQATCAVNETVSNVKETVHDGIESVKEAADVRAHIDRHPWVALGGAVLCGYVLGHVLTEREPRPRWVAPFPTPPINGGRETALQQTAPQQKPSGGLLASFEPEIKHLKGIALGAALGMLRQVVTEQVPPQIAEPLGDIINDITKKIGGEPLPDLKTDSAQACSTPGFAGRM